MDKYKEWLLELDLFTLGKVSLMGWGTQYCLYNVFL